MSQFNTIFFCIHATDKYLINEYVKQEIICNYFVLSIQKKIKKKTPKKPVHYMAIVKKLFDIIP